MGESFIASALEIQKGRKPDWNAARAHIETLDKEQLRKAVLDGLGADSLDEIDIGPDPEEMAGKRFKLVGTNWEPDDYFAPKACRQKLLGVVDFLEENWDEHAFDLAYTTIAVFADATWGDTPEGVDKVSLFCASGAASATGCLVPEPEPPHDMGLVPCKLMVEVHYDKDKTDAESLASAMDTLLTTALSTPGILDDYGPVEVGEFFVLTEP